MRNILLLTCLILVSSISIGQTYKISGFVTDSENGEALSYASIMILNHAIGISTDKKGFFELALPDSLKMDSLIVSYVGYKSRHICINGFRNDTITLAPQTFYLSEVVIKPSTKKSNTIIVNQFNKNDCEIRYSKDPFNGGGNLWVPYRAKEPSIESMYFPYKPDYGFTNKIKEIWVYLKNFKTTPTYCRLRILNASNALNPDEDLLTEPINLIVTEKNQLLKINLEKYNLSLPKSGIFIGVELLIISENAREIQNNLGDATTLYSPFLYYFPTSESEYKFWLYSKGSWIKQSTSVPEYNTKKIKNLFYKPAITLVLCD
jgi:hypothetical protein